jgi:hypothetical protein
MMMITHRHPLYAHIFWRRSIASLSFLLHSGLTCVEDSSTNGIDKRGKKSKVYMGMLKSLKKR